MIIEPTGEMPKVNGTEVLKQIKTDKTEERPVLIYEHAKSGDVFIVPDVLLRLDELEHVQAEVSQLLKNAT